MVNFIDFKENSDRNNTIIQNSLREIEPQTLLNALHGTDENIKNIFLRNMSPRAVEFLLKDMEGKKAISESQRTEAQEILKAKLKKNSES